MTYDQRPSRIKLVSGGAPVPASKDENATPAAVERLVEDSHPDEERVPRSTRMRKILFLVGCAIGGAAVPAWPHFVS
ncbi:hypothetical protein TMRH483_01034 [Qipengyuania sp. 483]